MPCRANDVAFGNDVRFAHDVSCGTWGNHKALRADIMNIKKGEIMKDNKLADLSMDFSVQIINLVKNLKSKHESVISNQIGRSGTSIGANIYEANYAQGAKDFVSKLEIALKEASETGYWLDLLFKTHYIDESTYKPVSVSPPPRPRRRRSRRCRPTPVS